MNSNKIDIVLNDSHERNLSLRSVVVINVNDEKLIEDISFKFENIYVFTDNKFVMGQYQKMMRRFVNVHPSYLNDLSKLDNVDFVIFDKISDSLLFNISKSKYLFFVNEEPKIINGFNSVEIGIFIKDDDIISLTADTNDKVSLVKLNKINPIQHSYGKYKRIEKGKTDLVGRDINLLNSKSYECPYSNKWIFKKASDLNEIILKDDISDEDMMKVVEMLSNAEHKELIK